MHRRKLVYDFIRACLDLVDWLWDRGWRYVLLAMVVAAGVVWWRVVGYA